MADIKASKPLKELGKNSSIYLEVGDKDNSDRVIRFAFLETAQIGYEIWGENDGSDPEDKRKAIVYRAFKEEDLPTDITPRVGKYGPSKVKEVLAAKVWDYATGEVKLLTSNQGTVINQFLTVEEDEDLKGVASYKWKITWNEEAGLKRKYEVLRLDDFQVTDEINEAYMESKIDVDRYIKGLSPIKSETKEKEEVGSSESASEVYDKF